MALLVLLALLLLLAEQGEAQKQDPYQVMGLPKDANEVQIKKAFRKLARTYHPDNADTGNEAKYIELVEANDILSDPERREHYDRFGHSSNNFGHQSGGSGTGFQGMRMNADLGDLFKRFAQANGGA